MKPERMLLGFSSALYCLNGVLWQWFAHNTKLAFLSVGVAILSAAWLSMTRDE